MPAVGNIVLISYPQPGGGMKPRPALVLAPLPGPLQVWLLCGISSARIDSVPDWDELLPSAADWFSMTNLARDSVSRLSFLDAVESSAVRAVIGRVPDEVVQRQRERLAAILRDPIS